MTTIKSYTDLEQSKKLSQILPLESADMKWYFWKSEIDAPKLPTFGYSKDAAENYKSTEAVYLPCWSLAALLGVLPNNKYISTTLSRGGWKIETTEYVDKWWCEYEDNDHTKDFSVSADNPIDACVAMIEKLYKLKML
jgi:hypothetical protein